MKMNMGETIKQARKILGISQEALAEELGVSVQAVSKWECGLSHPDISLLPQLADYLGVSLDLLLRGEETEAKEGMSALPNDNILRVVQCIGQKIISKEEWQHQGEQKKIPLCVDGSQIASVEIWGSAEIEGDISGAVSAGSSVVCGDVSGHVSAGSSVTCSDVSGSVSAGASVSCLDVGGNVSAGGSVTYGK